MKIDIEKLYEIIRDGDNYFGDLLEDDFENQYPYIGYYEPLPWLDNLDDFLNNWSFEFHEKGVCARTTENYYDGYKTDILKVIPYEWLDMDAERYIEEMVLEMKRDSEVKHEERLREIKSNVFLLRESLSNIGQKELSEEVYKIEQKIKEL